MTADGVLITAAGEAYDSGRGQITGAGEAYDSGRRANYSGRRGLMTADGGLITAAGEP